MPAPLRESDPLRLAEEAGLEYVEADAPGYTRRVAGRGFSYRDLSGERIDPPERDRLEELAVPPAWTDVWLSPDPDAHMLARGTDAAGRTQYVYHPEFRALADRLKFARLPYFARALPGLRDFVDEGLAGEPGSERFAVAGLLRLLDVGLLRIGNEESAADGHHGATTLAPRHVRQGRDLVLEFTGKGGGERRVAIDDDELVDALGELADARGGRLFWFRDEDGERRSVSAAEVNRTIDDVAGAAFSAKDFRTWGGSRVALRARAEGAGALEAVDAAAETLGNTRAVARASYVHPAVISAADEEVAEVWAASRSSRRYLREESALRKLMAPD